MTATPKYYPAEDVKPAKAVYRVKQNVSVFASAMVIPFIAAVAVSIPVLLSSVGILHRQEVNAVPEYRTKGEQEQ